MKNKTVIHYESSLVCSLQTHIFRKLSNSKVGYLTIMFIPEKYRSFKILTQEEALEEIKSLKYIGGYEK